MRGIEVDHLGQQQPWRGTRPRREPPSCARRPGARGRRAGRPGPSPPPSAPRCSCRATACARRRADSAPARHRRMWPHRRSGCRRSDIETLRAEGRLIGRRTLREPPDRAPGGPPPGGTRRAPPRSGCSMDGTRRAEPISDRADHQAVHHAWPAKAHLSLGRMHVDVHVLGRELQEQGDHRLPVTRQQIAIGRAQAPLSSRSWTGRRFTNRC